MTYISPRRRRINRQARNDLVRHIVNVVGGTVALFIIAMFFSFILINWISGCGERFPTADGGYIQGECIYPSDLWNDYRQSHRTQEDK
jgi:hypothetical protein